MRGFIVLVSMASPFIGGCALFDREPVYAPYSRPIARPVAPQVPVAPDYTTGPGYSADGVFGMTMMVPGGITSVNATRLRGRWPDGTAVVIFDRDRDGNVPGEQQAKLLAEYEAEWYRRKKEMNKSP